MGISEEMKDAKITAEKTQMSILKRRAENWPKFAWSNWTLRYKTVKTCKNYRKYLLFLNFGIWPHFTAILTMVSYVPYYKAQNEQASARVILSSNSICYTSTRERALHHSDWLYKFFSHVKIKRIDFYKWALWNKILVVCAINCFSWI